MDNCRQQGRLTYSRNAGIFLAFHSGSPPSSVTIYCIHLGRSSCPLSYSRFKCTYTQIIRNFVQNFIPNTNLILTVFSEIRFPLTYLPEMFIKLLQVNSPLIHPLRILSRRFRPSSPLDGLKRTCPARRCPMFFRQNGSRRLSPSSPAL